MNKRLVSGVLSVLMATSMCMSAFAEEEREKIGVVTLDISATYDANDEVDEDAFSVETSTEGCEVSEYELDYDSATKQGGEEWSKYDTPVLVIYLTADGDYYFDKTSKGAFKLEGTKAEFISASRGGDKDEMTVKVRLTSLNGKVGNVSNLYWDDTSVAHWEKGYNTRNYEVKLYCDNSVVATYNTSNLSYDFANDMKKVGTYHFTVRGYSSSKTKSDAIESPFININDVQANELSQKAVDNTKTHKTTNSGGPSGTSSNTNSSSNLTGPGNNTTTSTGKDEWVAVGDKWWFRHSDGHYTSNNWELINGKWYYFDEAGWMVTGWRLVNNVWYYMDASGAMTTGWQYIGNSWYYLGASGAMMTGWADINGARYYLTESGAMAEGSIELNGVKYNFDASGALIR